MGVIYLSGYNGKYHATVEDERMRKHTNRTETIKRMVERLEKEVVRARFLQDTNDLKLYDREGGILILRDYEAVKHDPLYRPLVKKLDEIDVEIVLPRIKNREKVSGRVGFFNKKRLAVLGLTIVLCTSLVAFQKNEANAREIVMTSSIKKEETIVSSVGENRPEIYRPSPEERAWTQWMTNFEAGTRFLQTQGFRNVEEYDPNTITLGTRVNIERFQKLMTEETGQIFLEMADIYGVDPYLLMAIGMTESSLNHQATIPGGWAYNGHGVGITQQEDPAPGKYVTARNYRTNQEDTVEITMENALDLRTNIQLGAMTLQKNMNVFGNNVYLTIQSYNYGTGVVQLAVSRYAKEMGKSYDEVVASIHDMGWMKYIKDIHDHPQKYFRWGGRTYGNDHYIADVLSYYIGIYSRNKLPDGTDMVINMDTLEVGIHNFEEEYQAVLATNPQNQINFSPRGGKGDVEHPVLKK